MVGDKGIVGGDDLGEGMQCSDHPYRSNPGGICAFCLQEKLGKLVSSSKSNPFFPIPPPTSSSSSSSPSFRSDLAFASAAGASNGSTHTKIPFLSASNDNKKTASAATSHNHYLSSGGGRKNDTTSATTSSSSAGNNSLALMRSKSLAPARPVIVEVAADSPRKKSFWSFLNLSSSSSSTSSSSAANNKRPSSSSSGEARAPKQHSLDGPADGGSVATDKAPVPRKEAVGDELEGSFGRKVARSRSVGCGSRSFSGDFLERISTGFGDCTLRRVESQRESKPKIVLHHHHRVTGAGDDEQRIKERVKCGGIFGGFGIISASSYWLAAATAASTADAEEYESAGHVARGVNPHGRSRSWGWAFASPMRALRTSSASKQYSGHKNEATATSTVTTSTAIKGSADMATTNISTSDPPLQLSVC